MPLYIRTIYVEMLLEMGNDMERMGIKFTNINNNLTILLLISLEFTDDLVVIAKDKDGVKCTSRKLTEEYEK